MAWQDPTYSIGHEYVLDENGDLIDIDADSDTSIPVEYELPVEHLTEVANHPERLQDYLIRVPNIYERDGCLLYTSDAADE